MSGRHKHPRRTIAGLTAAEYAAQQRHAQALDPPRTWSEWVRETLRAAVEGAPPAPERRTAVRWRREK